MLSGLFQIYVALIEYEKGHFDDQETSHLNRLVFEPVLLEFSADIERLWKDPLTGKLMKETFRRWNAWGK